MAWEGPLFPRNARSEKDGKGRLVGFFRILLDSQKNNRCAAGGCRAVFKEREYL